MARAQLANNSIWDNYTNNDSIIAFSSIIILSIISLLLGSKPFNTAENSQYQHHYKYVAIPSATQTSLRLMAEKSPWKNISIRKHDTLAGIFKNHHIDSTVIPELLALGKIAEPLNALTPYRQLQVIVKQHELQQLRYHFSSDQWLVISKHGDAYQARVEKQKLEPHVHFTHGTINKSLYADAHSAGLSDFLIYELTNNLGWDIDFAKDIRPGDSFAVIYNDYYIGDKRMREGDVLAASFTTQGKTYKIVRYTDPKGHSHYYTPTGRSVKKAFIRTPVKFKRISSTFSQARKHPILNKIRAHRGIDYAAKRGTPIRAAGDGVIIMRKRNGGYGNMIMIKHGVKYKTVYGHMSRFAKGFKVGSHVKQGQIIGYVGQTGLATGPHLHYEVRILGKYVNPMRVKLPRAAPVPAKYRKNFLTKTQALMAELNLYQSAIDAS